MAMRRAFFSGCVEAPGGRPVLNGPLGEYSHSYMALLTLVYMMFLLETLENSFRFERGMKSEWG